VRPRPVLAVALALAGAAGSVTSAAAPQKQPYPLLVDRGTLRVFGPGAEQPWGRCPRGALPLGRADLRKAEHVALQLVAVFKRQGRYREIDTSGAHARAARLGSAVWTRWGLAKTTCGAAIVSRTLAVGVGYPRVNWSASLSSSTFFVSRIRAGWIFWHQPH
jgi:hypothetical protein